MAAGFGSWNLVLGSFQQKRPGKYSPAGAFSLGFALTAKIVAQ
jgi:hypothetical protein